MTSYGKTICHKAVKKLRSTRTSIKRRISPHSTQHPAHEPLPLVPKIELRNITTYAENNQKILNGLSLEIEAGQNICIASLQKDEESSLLSLLRCLESPPKGTVTIGDTTTKKVCTQCLRNKTFLMLENPWIFKGTLADNITFGSCKARTKDIDHAIEIAGLQKILQPLDLTLGSTLEPQKLTLYQRKKIHLTRAALRKPSLLLVTSPTENLSPDEEADIAETLKKLRKDRTTITFSRRLKMARHADSVFVLDQGKLQPYSGQTTIWNTPAAAPSLLWDTNNQELPTRQPKKLLTISTEKLTTAPEPQTITLRRKQQILPAHTTTGLLTRTKYIDTWIAWSSKNVCPVRIKVPRIYPVVEAAHESLIREYNSVSQFNHPNIVQTYDAELGVDIPYTMYEYLDTPSLKTMIQQATEGIDTINTLYLAYDLAGALKKIHQHGYTCLTLSPNHIRQRSGTWVLADFTNLTKHGTPIQSLLTNPSTIPPELIANKKSSYAMDSYSFGRLLYQAITGKSDPGENDFSQYLIDKTMPGIPQPMRNVIRAMLSKDPQQRPSMDRAEWEFKRLMSPYMRQDRLKQARQSVSNLYRLPTI